MGKVIATDLDGTLLYPKKRVRMISTKTLRFLRKFADDGGKIVLVSGRNSEYLEKVAKKIDRKCDMIGCNASFVISNDEYIKKVYFNNARLEEILDDIEKTYKPKTFFLMSEDNQFIMRDSFESRLYSAGYALWNFFEGVYREPFIVDKEKFNEILHTGKIRKIMIFFGIGKKNVNSSKEANKGIYEKYKNEVEPSWSGEFIELSPFGCSKSEGLKYYIQYNKINHNDVYVVGDSGNDISMFKEFPENSFCMKHSPLSVSKYAKHVIKHFSDLEKYIV